MVRVYTLRQKVHLTHAGPAVDVNLGEIRNAHSSDQSPQCYHVGVRLRVEIPEYRLSATQHLSECAFTESYSVPCQNEELWLELISEKPRDAVRKTATVSDPMNDIDQTARMTKCCSGTDDRRLSLAGPAGS
jgi:hypothetical protein